MYNIGGEDVKCDGIGAADIRCAAASKIAEDTIFMMRRIRKEESEESGPDGGVDEDRVAEEEEGGRARGRAGQAIGEACAVGSGNVGVYGRIGGGRDWAGGCEGVERSKVYGGGGGERSEIAWCGREDVVQAVGPSSGARNNSTHY